VPDLHRHLTALFGFDGFRPGQEAVVRAAVSDRDTLAVMPTGSGKSLTYQLAATLRDRPTLVLSPLIALMKDQVDNLPPALAPRATFLNSSLSGAETATRVGDVRRGATRLLYAAPERLRQQGFVDLLREVDVGLVVIDEVHCVSMWGHDFRPDYLFIRQALDVLDRPAILGMTATATPAAVDEIARALGREPEVVRTSVVRPNLRYDVALCENADDRLRILVGRLRELAGATAIIYARSRRSCEEIARTLRGHGLAFEHYHAGLEPAERTRIQDAFVSSTIQGVVATTAFGMGIDKPDVRLVCLVNLPDSLETYVQMVGRAGRDGAPSDTLLLASAADARTLERFALEGLPTPSDLRRTYRALRDAGGRIEAEQLFLEVGSDHDPRVLVGMLERAGCVRRGYDAGRFLQVELPPVPPGVGADVDALLERYRAGAAERVAGMIAFAESVRCRHAQVAEHFGERLEEPCGACDVCAPTAGTAVARPARRALPDDAGEAIVRAVGRLTWPLGRRSLVAMLRGSISAPPSARNAPDYGVLAAANEAQVTRWIRALETAGALVQVETPDGFRVLRAVSGAALPVLRTRAAEHGDPPADTPTAAALRTWRARRARHDGVPAYVVCSDATLHEIAASRPTSRPELAGVRGIGPAKLERYGDDILAVVAGAAG
jgi:ATP-dependent DNA helicase RecQ